MKTKLFNPVLTVSTTYPTSVNVENITSDKPATLNDVLNAYEKQRDFAIFSSDITKEDLYLEPSIRLTEDLHRNTVIANHLEDIKAGSFRHSPEKEVKINYDYENNVGDEKDDKINRSLFDDSIAAFIAGNLALSDNEKVKTSMSATPEEWFTEIAKIIRLVNSSKVEEEKVLLKIHERFIDNKELHDIFNQYVVNYYPIMPQSLIKTINKIDIIGLEKLPTYMVFTMYLNKIYTEIHEYELANFEKVNFSRKEIKSRVDNLLINAGVKPNTNQELINALTTVFLDNLKTLNELDFSSDEKEVLVYRTLTRALTVANEVTIKSIRTIKRLRKAK